MYPIEKAHAEHFTERRHAVGLRFILTISLCLFICSLLLTGIVGKMRSATTVVVATSVIGAIQGAFGQRCRVETIR